MLPYVMRFNDPIAFEENLAPLVGDVFVRPMKGHLFNANIEKRKLRKAGLFTIESNSFCAKKAPNQNLFGFTLPMRESFSVTESGLTYGRGNAHILSPDRPFTLKLEKNCNIMACGIFADPLKQYKERIFQTTSFKERAPNQSVSLVSAEGSAVFRSLVKAWVALGSEATLTSAISLREIEDDLLSSFLLLIDDTPTKDANLPTRFAVKRIEEYIAANLDKAITREDLATITSVSMRSLSRAFRNKYGLGPMEFVRQRRLDACYTQLRSSDPLEATVTDVAMSYGFGHIGRFAIDYKQAFGELPSISLRVA